jgi:1-acyl-sn-glycerol-3-phosphate acyltransferase
MCFVGRYLLSVPFKGPDVDRGIQLCKQFTNILLPVLGVKTTITGTFPKGGGLLVANHRSYLDPFLLMKDISARPVGKVAVAKWPIIGIAGKVAGAIFVDRSHPESRKKARQTIGQAIRESYFIINFPEGTTQSQPATTTFKPGVFNDAAKEGFPIYPVTLEFQKSNDFWVGNDTFIRHFLECFAKPHTHVKLHYGEAIYSDDPDKLMRMAQQHIDQQLLCLRADWFEST